MATPADSPAETLAGCRVAITRERPGRLAALLRARGASVVHVPLIEVVDPDDDGAALAAALAEPSAVDWVLVTSAPGAERIAPLLTAADRGDGDGTVRIGCVGTATARRIEELLGREADLVPERQQAAELAREFIDRHEGRPQRVVVAQADRADGALTDALRSASHHVTPVTAYRTLLRRPTPDEIARLRDVDAVLFASGSAAASWAEVLGARAADLLPERVVAMGPTTASIAEHNGLKVTSVAADHSVPGIVAELEAVWRARPSTSDRDDPMA